MHSVDYNRSGRWPLVASPVDNCYSYCKYVVPLGHGTFWLVVAALQLASCILDTSALCEDFDTAVVAVALTVVVTLAVAVVESRAVVADSDTAAVAAAGAVVAAASRWVAVVDDESVAVWVVRWVAVLAVAYRHFVAVVVVVVDSSAVVAYNYFVHAGNSVRLAM